MRGLNLPAAFLLAWIAASLAAPAAAQFTGTPGFGSHHTISVAWGDYDGDGDLDLAVGESGEQNHLYRNDGAGVWTELDEFEAGYTFAVVWVDVDNDGDRDMAVGNGSGQQNRLFLNDGTGFFTGINRFGTNRTSALAFADYDLDGDVDCAVGNGLLNVNQNNKLFVGNGAGGFNGQNQFGAKQTATLVWGDANGDGWPDMAVGNGGFISAPDTNYLYLNAGDGSFTERVEFGVNDDTACLAWGDADGDGDLDLAVGNWNAGQNYLYRNDGAANFSEEAQFGPRDTNTLAWGDADNDGDLDVAVGNGDFGSADSNYLYVNDGTGQFVEVQEFGLGSTDALAFADPDADGDLDVVSGNEHTPTQNYYYENLHFPRGTAGWLDVHLVGRFHDMGAGYSNRDGLGAKVYVYDEGWMGDPAHLRGFREVEAHGGFSSQNMTDPHFAVPGAVSVDVRVVWPGSGGSRIVQDVPGVPVGQRVTIEETAPPVGASADWGIGETVEAAASSDGSARVASVRAAPNPMSGSTRITLETEAPGVTALEVFNVTGQRVRTLNLPASTAGGARSVQWDGRNDAGRSVPTGTYFVRVPGVGSVAGARVVVVR